MFEHTSPRCDAPRGCSTGSVHRDPLLALATTVFALFFATFTSGTLARAEEPIHLVQDFALSPDGSQLVFGWAGDLWTVASTGGSARLLTTHAADDRNPCYSPDGAEIAFISNRWGGRRYQIYTLSADGGTPRRHTAHSEGYALEQYDPTGEGFIARGSRDHHWRQAGRLLRVTRDPQIRDEVIFDAAVTEGRVSPDGKKVLFRREGAPWARKGYEGSQAGQIWRYDVAAGTFEKLLHDDFGYRYPRWRPDGRGFYYVGRQSGSFNLWLYSFEDGSRRQLTDYDDDSVFWPELSADGSTLVYRYRFDLYRVALRPDGRFASAPQRIDITNPGEVRRKEIVRDMLSDAEEAMFSPDALEIAFISGGDLWVMDTELREPKQITSTPEEEREPVWDAEYSRIFFIRESNGQSDIWVATRRDEQAYWWQQDDFRVERLTDDPEAEVDLNRIPGGRLAYVKGGGDLIVMDPDGKNAERLIKSWDRPDYDFSPDGRWIAYSVDDNDFNRDIWIKPVDGSREPFNLSTHPDNDYSPRWSPDGRLLAFTGRRVDDESDIYYVWLRKEDAEEGSRDRTLEKAIEKMKKRESSKKKDDKKDEKKDDEKKDDDKADKADEKLPGPETVIDFDGLRDRISRISIADSTERGLVWIGDRDLAFQATVDGRRGVYHVEFPDQLRPSLLSTSVPRFAVFLPKAKVLAGLSGGRPTTWTTKGKSESYPFRMRHEYRRAEKFGVAFDLAWRYMRDGFYDENLGNRNWDAIRRKYREVATEAVDADQFDQVVTMMLGELNASHLGFSSRGGGYDSDEPWAETTAHLGLTFDPAYKGPGWKVASVIPDGPADQERSTVRAGEVVTSIDGRTLDPSLSEAAVLNGPLDRDIALRVRSSDGDEEREVVIRPTSYGGARSLLYPAWLERNREVVRERSEDRLGYLHIRGMNWSSFLKFEEELFKIGAGKDGLIIDVRANGGGFTADHLLTVLTAPKHAITVPRGGGPGYPQDRRVYASWQKPIVVLCDQDSFSNAEIFAHAIKTLDRGRLVGVTTAGGVISTGGTSVLDIGFLRMPFRGWFVASSGEDMELNGAVPHFTIWPEPGERVHGVDRQLEKAIEVLNHDVAEWKNRPRPTLRKASERQLQPVKVERF